MLYCEKCRMNTEGDCCPECGRKKLREIREDDPCFLIERDAIWSEVVEDFLKENGIPFLTKGKMGAGLAIHVGPMFEKNRYYVPYACLERARELTDALFAGGDTSDGDDESGQE